MLIVLQARISSSRLPAKVLLPVGGMPLAILCARRLASSGHTVVLATSDSTSDDILAWTAQAAGITVFRGSLTNVLDRFVQCISSMKDNDIVVRATADNPLPNGAFVDTLVQRFYQGGGMYLGTSWPDDGLPYGLSAEVMTAGALRRAAASTDNPYDREHVTPWLRREAGSAGRARRDWFFAQDLSQLRATIDTLDDYVAMALAFHGVKEPVSLDWQALLPRLPKGELPRRSVPTVQRNGECYGSMMLGTAQLGMTYGIANRTGRPSDQDVAAMLEMAAHGGVTHIDTARSYGDAESRIGVLLSGIAKVAIKVVTKLQPMDSFPEDTPEREINTAVDASVFGSCRELRREQLDILMFHRITDMFRWKGAAMRRLQHHVARKVVQAIGVSVYTPEEAVKSLRDDRIMHLQIPFNLLDSRWLDSNCLEMLARRPSVCVHVRSVFLQGLLINDANTWPAWVDQRYEFVSRIEEVTKELQRKSKLDLCIAYARCFPWVTSLVLGAETPEQLHELLSGIAEPVLTTEQATFARTRFAHVPERLLNPSQW